MIYDHGTRGADGLFQVTGLKPAPARADPWAFTLFLYLLSHGIGKLNETRDAGQARARASFAGILSQLDLRVAGPGVWPEAEEAGNETPDAGLAPARASLSFAGLHIST